VRDLQMSVSGLQLSVRDLQMSVSGSQMSVRDLQMSVSGSRMSVSGSRMSVSGSQMSVRDLQMSVSGSRMSGSGGGNSKFRDEPHGLHEQFLCKTSIYVRVVCSVRVFFNLEFPERRPAPLTG